MSLGKNIKALREHNGWTLEDLSSKTNNEVDVGTIHALEKRNSTRSRYAPQLAKAFGITLEELLATDFNLLRLRQPLEDGGVEDLELLSIRPRRPDHHVDDSTVLDLMDEMLHAIAPTRRSAAAEILASWAREGGGDHWKRSFKALVDAKQTDAPAAA